jgi:hypothetical protein
VSIQFWLSPEIVGISSTKIIFPPHILHGWDISGAGEGYTYSSSMLIPNAALALSRVKGFSCTLALI